MKKDFKEITPDEFAKLAEKEQVDYLTDLQVYKEEKLNSLMDQLKTENTETIKTEIAKLTKEIGETSEKQIKAMYDTLKVQGNAINQLMTKGVPNEKLTLVQELEAKKAEIKALANDKTKSVELKTLVLRAAVADNENAFVLPDIGQLAHKKLNAIDIFPKFRLTDRNDNGTIRYYDWDSATAARAADAIAEGAAFPASTAAWAGYTLDIQKIGDSIGYTEEMAEDSAMFAAELGMFLETNVKIKENDQIVNGVGTTKYIKGLVASVDAYTPAAAGITDASIYDLIVKLREAIESPYGGKYMVDFALMNLSDINKYKLKKDANNNYIIPPFKSGDNVIDGVTIIEDNSVTANTMIIGDRRFGRVYEKTAYELSEGMVGDQFLEDERTLKVRRRLAFLIRTVDKTGFLKVTSISAALTTLAQ